MTHAETDSSSVSNRQSTAFPIIFGGTISSATREAIERGERARADVLEMEKVFNSPIYDFGCLHNTARYNVRARAALMAARHTGRWPQALAAEVLGRVARGQVVYATGEDVGFALAAHARTLRLHSPKIVVRLEQPDYGKTPMRRGLFEQYRAYALPRISRILCRTTAHMQKLSSLDRYPYSQLHFAPETTDPSFYQPNKQLQDIERYTYGDEPLIVSAGLEARDYQTVIEAVRGLPVQLVIGAGSPWSRESFKQRPTSTLPPNVHVGRFAPEEMRGLYQAAAFVVVPVEPTLRACGMNVVLEAWAMERAVLATRTVGLRDYIVEDENGILVEPYSVGEMRQGIQRLLGDTALARKIGCAGRQRIAEDLNVDQYVERIGRIVAEVRDND